MQETELYSQDSILGWFVSGAAVLYPFTWGNITNGLEFVYKLVDYQDTYHQDQENETDVGFYHQALNIKPAGSYIDNEGYGKYGHEIIAHLKWHSPDKPVVLNGNITVAAPLSSLTISGPSVVLRDLVTRDIDRVFVTTAIDCEDNETKCYQGPIIGRNLGNKKEPIYEFSLNASSVALSGDIWTANQTTINAFALYANSSKSLIIRDYTCSLDLSRIRTFVGYDITLQVHGQVGCAVLDGTFLAQNSFVVRAPKVRQNGLIVSKGLAEILVDKAAIDGKIIGKTIVFARGDYLLLNINSTIKSNENLIVEGYTNITSKGMVEAKTVTVTSGSFEQPANGTISSELLRFDRMGSLVLCGNVTAGEVVIESNYTRFCETARGNIKRLVLIGGEFYQDGEVKIGEVISNGTSVRFLTETSRSLLVQGTSLASLTLNNSTFGFNGTLYAGNITLGIRGDLLLTGHMSSQRIQVNATGAIINEAKLASMSAEFIATSFTNEEGGDLNMKGEAAFCLSDRMDLNPGSEMHLGAITASTVEGDNLNEFSCSGCQLIVNGTEVSTILTKLLINQIEFYKKLTDTLPCGSDTYRWVSGSYQYYAGSPSKPLKYKTAHTYSTGSSNCIQEQHSYGDKGIIDIRGLNLGAERIMFELSDTYIKDLNLITPTRDPAIDSKHIDKVVTVSAGVIGGTNSPHTCVTIAKSYDIEGASCIRNADGSYTLRKVIKEISSSLVVSGGVECLIEEGLRLNWQKYIGSNKPTATSSALIDISSALALKQQALADYYTSPAITLHSFDIDTFFNGKSINSRLLKPLIPSQNLPDFISSEGALQLYASLSSPSFEVVCDQEYDQDQLDCEQYSFLLKLGFTGDVPTQFDFGTCKKIVRTFIYQRTDFQLIKVISKYGPDMFRDFVHTALEAYRELDLIPGYPVSKEKQEALRGPIVWPVWKDGCMSKDEKGNLFFVGIRCLSYELYIPKEFYTDQIRGAVFAGDKIDITINGLVVIGPGGRVVQLQTNIDSQVGQVEEGKGSITIAHKSTEVIISEDGTPMALTVRNGDVHNFGTIGGMISLDVRDGDYVQQGGMLSGIDTVQIKANKITQGPLMSQDGQVVAQAKSHLFCTKGTEHCVSRMESTKGDINRLAVLSYVNGSSIIKSARDLNEYSLHTRTQRSYYEGDTYISRAEFQTYRQQAYIEGMISHTAEEMYRGYGIGYYIAGGGVIEGNVMTDAKALTDVGPYYSEHTREGFWSDTTTITEGIVTTTSFVEIEGGTPSSPITIGTSLSGSTTKIEGLISIGGKTGPRIVIRGGAGVYMIEHLIPEMMRTTVERSGFLGASSSKPSFSNVRGARTIESIKHGDFVGLITGAITDVVGGLNTHNAAMGTKWIKDLPMAGGVAIAAALLSEIFHVRVSFGEEITVISQEGFTAVPNIIGDASVKEGFFGIYSGGDAVVQTRVNVEKIEAIIATNLNLMHYTDKQSIKMEQQRNSLNFDLSLSSISAGVSHSFGKNKQTIEKHHPT